MYSKSRARAKAVLVISIIATIALFSFSTSEPARAADALQPRHEFKIPAQTLDVALLAFAEQAKVKVLMWAQTREDARSPGATGDLSAVNALTSILNGTGLSFQQVDADTVAIVEAGTSAKVISNWLNSADGAGKLRLAQFVQVVQADADQPSPGSATAAGSAPEELNEVQVTGTRIIREGYEAPTPVTVVGLQQLQDAASVQIADTLNEMPAFQASETPANSGTTNTGVGGMNLVNLRGLNSGGGVSPENRVLVLFDGRRMPPDVPQNFVDIDMIPDALVQRVDVVTGGASAIYGSDAVSGVVNFVLNTNFTGVQGLIQGGISGQGDGANNKLQLTLGTSFADGRGHFEISGDQDYQSEIFTAARSWALNGFVTIQNPKYKAGNGQPQMIDAYDVGPAAGNPGGIISGGPLQGTAFGPGGTPFQWNYGSLLDGSFQVGGDWATSTEAGAESLLPEMGSTHLFARASFDITPDVQVYSEFVNGNVHTNATCCDTYYLGNLTVSPNNPYLPASVAAQATADGLTSLPYGITFKTPSHGFGGINEHYNDIYVLGAKGKFSALKSDWNWDVYGQQGVSVTNTWTPYQTNTTNFTNATNAVRVTTANVGTSGLPIGSIQCAVTLTNPNSGCVPYDIFGTGVASQAAINYAFGGPWIRQTMGQNIVGGSITGEPFSTWAGPVSVAADVEYRRDSIDGNSDAVSRVAGWFSTQLRAYDANEHVEEGALETVVPLIKDMKWAQALDFNAAARATEYSTSGYVTTYKYGLEYTPITDFRFRATESVDIRAPNLNELFAGASEIHGTIADPAEGNQSYATFEITASNPNLKPEKAHTTGIGVVFQPIELPGFGASIDYYRINLQDAISTVSDLFILQECYANPASSYCALILRNPDNTLNTITAIPENIASLVAEGVDYEASYQKRLDALVSSWKGTLGMRLAATETLHLITNTNIPGPAQILDAAGSGNTPRWGVIGTLSYDLDPWRIAWTSRYDSAVKVSDADIQCSTNCPTPVPTGFITINRNYVPSYIVSNVSVNYTFLEHDSKTAEAFVAINNVLDRIPPPVAGGGATYGLYTNPDLYDTIGVAFRAGIRFKL